MERKRRTSWTHRAIMLVVMCSLSAWVWAQKPLVTLQAKDVKVEQALIQLRKKSGYRLLFNHEEVAQAGRKSIDMKERPLNEVLDALLANTGLSYKIEKDVVVIIPVQQKKATSTKTKRSVSGRVRDKNGDPIPGAAIMQLGTQTGTTTDVDGRYTLEVNNDGYVCLRFSMLGMKSAEVVVERRNEIDVVLEEDVKLLDDVVITGYQSISKERSAGAFSVIGGNDITDKAGLRGNIIESLEGMTTGLSVNFGEGQEKFLIRGITSINSTRSPLYVVDGIPMEADDFEKMINSNDIDKVTFLKDATAASIWGSQAANGVVVITTKEGNATDKKVKFSYNGAFTYKGKPRYDYLNYMSSEQFVRAAQEIFNPDFYTWDAVTTSSIGTSGNLPVVYPHEQIMYDRLNGVLSESEATQSLQRLAATNNRQQIEDNFYTAAFYTTHSLSFQGGKEKYNFYGSFGYQHDTSYLHDHSNEYQLNLKQNFELAKWLHADLSVNLALTDDKNAITPYATNLNSVQPYMMFADENGDAVSHASLMYYEPNRLEYEEKSGKSLDYRPLSDNQNGFNKLSGYDARVNLGLQANLLKGLTYSGRFHYQRGNSKSEQYSDQDSYRVRYELVRMATVNSDTGSPVFCLPVTGGFYSTSTANRTDWTVRNQLNYDHLFEKIRRS